MKIDSLGYLIKEGFRSIKVNKLMTLASVGVLVSCMLLMGCSVLVSENTNQMLNQIEQENVIMVFMDDNATEEQEQSVRASIEAIDNVKSVSFVSKENAWKDQLAQMGEAQAEFFKNYADDSPLPDAYKVIVKSMDEFSSTVASIKKLDYIQNVRENSSLAKKLAQIKHAVNIICIAVVALLFAVSIFIISNTVRVAIYSRRFEISIEKSVGATDAFVRMPFVVEGTVIGIFSAGLSLLVVWGIYELAIKKLATLISVLNFSAVPFNSIWWILLLAFLAIGISCGAGGSALSMNKYLKHEGSELNVA